MEQKCSSQVWVIKTPALLQSVPQQQQMVTKRQMCWKKMKFFPFSNKCLWLHMSMDFHKQYSKLNLKLSYFKSSLTHPAKLYANYPLSNYPAYTVLSTCKNFISISFITKNLISINFISVSFITFTSISIKFIS